MPAYTLNGVGVLSFAGSKSHYSLYPASDALIEAFAKELAPYERSEARRMIASKRKPARKPRGISVASDTRRVVDDFWKDVAELTEGTYYCAGRRQPLAAAAAE